MAARVGVSVFGCTLSVSVGFVVNDGKLEAARARVERFLALGIANSQTPNPAAEVTARQGDQQLGNAAAQAAKSASAPAQPANPPTTPGLPPEVTNASLGRPVQPTNFWLVLRKISDTETLALLTPRDPSDQGEPAGAFYSSRRTAPDFEPGHPPADIYPVDSDPHLVVSHVLVFDDVAVFNGVERWIVSPDGGNFGDFAAGPQAGFVAVGARYTGSIAAQQANGAPQQTLSDTSFNLGFLLDECFLYDAVWSRGDAGKVTRTTRKWTEPTARFHETAEDNPGSNDLERAAERDKRQRDRQALVDSNPIDAAAHEARSTTMAMFLDQFVAMADGTDVGRDKARAHVSDLGLVFRLPAGFDATKFEKMRVVKADNFGKPDEAGYVFAANDAFDPAKLKSATIGGAVKVLNPRQLWFDRQEPVLARGKDPLPASDGVKLDWQLTISFLTGDLGALDPEHFLHHYEIWADMQDRPRWSAPKLLKPAVTLGDAETVEGSQLRRVTPLRPDWQFTDDLADLPANYRRALLPSTGEEGREPAAEAWTSAFGEADRVYLTYTIIPVDIAGARGSERAFVVEISRPALALRAAQGELRVYVKKGVYAADGFASETQPGQIAMVLALQDGALDLKKVDKRKYRLVAIPEVVVPTGAYGADGITERGSGLAAIGTANMPEKRVELTIERRLLSNDNRYLGDDAALIEPDAEARSKFTDWILLLGEGPGVGKTPLFPNADDFLKKLWSDEDTRLASTFYLVTDEGDEAHASQPAPLPLELIVENADPPGPNVAPALMRPQEFEWPARLDFPPHGLDGGVRARSGFALFRAPTEDATLRSLIKYKQMIKLRDPDRRVLTTVTWDAGPCWAGAAADYKRFALHASTIAGYDLFELDLDELAPMDTGAQAGRAPVPFATDATIWRRARLAARTQVLPQSLATLTPHGNDDWQGWQAHYPSETWRVKYRGQSKAPDEHNRVRANWYSAAELTLRFPDRILRRRLLPRADEQTIASILRGGKPASVTASLTVADPNKLWTPGDAADDPKKILTADDLASLTLAASLIVDEADLAREFDVQPQPHGGVVIKARKPSQFGDGKTFAANWLRALLLCLTWSPSPVTDQRWARSPGVDLGLSVRLDVDNGGVPAPFFVRIDFSSPLHPVLEETVAALAYTVSNNGARLLYERYKPVLQPRPKFDAADFSGFLTATAPGQDPYGWKALQMLGLAVTLRLYDGDAAAFVSPRDLWERLSDAMTDTVERYRKAPDDDLLGAPFAELLLRPGGDRVCGEFEAIVAVEQEQRSALTDDIALAVVQISMRPRPLAAWRYAALTGCWGQAFTQNVPLPVGPEKSTPIGVAWVLQPQDSPYDVFRPADRAFVGVADQVVLPAIRSPFANDTGPRDPELSLLVRYPAYDRTQRAAGPPPVADWVQLRCVNRTRTSVGGTIVDTDKLGGDDLTAKYVRNEQGSGFAVAAVAAPGSDVEAFGCFPAKAVDNPPPQSGGAAPPAPDDWLAALTKVDASNAPGPAKVGFDALQDWIVAARASAPRLAGPDQLKNVVQTYLDWSQRFLDHGEAPNAPKGVSVAFAAPIKATPWRLAATQDGAMSISLLHNDRWASSRAYAVRAFGRYRDLLVAAGAYRDPDTGQRLSSNTIEALVTPELLSKPNNQILAKPLAYAVAVSRRTEKMEPPLILGSASWNDTDPDPHHRDFRWTLIVASHSETQLAASNRPLLARLGAPRSATAFLRDYAHPKWPDNLATMKSSGDASNWPSADFGKEIAVDRSAGAPAPEAESFGGGDIAYLIKSGFPNLWKSAYAWRFDNLPHHYRAVALHVAVAGAVVSPIAAAVQTVFPVAQPSFDRFGGAAPPALTMACVRHPQVTKALVEIEWPLIAHADLMSEQTRHSWIQAYDGSNAADVGWWPDHDVVYALARETAGTPALREEDAEIRLTPKQDDGGAPQQEAVVTPIVVRARGAHFVDPGGFDPDHRGDPAWRQRWKDELPRVRRKTGANGDLQLWVKISLAPPDPAASKALASRRVVFTAGPDAGDIDTFNKAQDFALALTLFDVKVDLANLPGTVNETILAIQNLRDALISAAAALPPRDPFDTKGALTCEADRLQSVLTGFHAHPPATSGEAKGRAGLPSLVSCWTQAGDLAGLTPTAATPANQAMLALFALPDDIKMLDLAAVATPTGAALYAALRTLASGVLTGGAATMKLRAIHGRGGAVAHDVDIAWPAWRA